MNNDPLAPQREQKVGKALVVGNDYMASVVKVGLVRAAVVSFDNDRDAKKDIDKEPSAFNRAVKWAQENQNDARLAGGMFG